MLTIKDLHAYYGQIEALKGIDISVQEGKIVCLIGSNGAGKTTLLNAISRMIHTEGSIKWQSSVSCMFLPDGMCFPACPFVTIWNWVR